MIVKPHENPDYQTFLTSQTRSSLVPDSLYLNLFPEHIFGAQNIMEFGCGRGYVSLLLAVQHRHTADFHIYACDYQEDLLDDFWKKKVSLGLNNVTPFFNPDRSLIAFPKWLPAIDHLIFSFSLSAVEDPYTVLTSVKKILSESGEVHIIDWQHNAKDKTIEKLFAPEHRLTHMILSQWLELTGYKVVESKTDYENVFYIRAEVFLA